MKPQVIGHFAAVPVPRFLAFGAIIEKATDVATTKKTGEWAKQVGIMTVAWSASRADLLGPYAESAGRAGR